MSLQVSNSTSLLLQNFNFTSLLPQNIVNNTFAISSSVESLFKKLSEFTFDSSVISNIDLTSLLPNFPDKKNTRSLFNLIQNDISMNYGQVIAPIEIQVFTARRRKQGENERLQIVRQDIREQRAAEERALQQRQNEAKEFVNNHAPVAHRGESSFMRKLRTICDAVKVMLETVTYVSACWRLIKRFLG